MGLVAVATNPIPKLGGAQDGPDPIVSSSSSVAGPRSTQLNVIADD
jgi:hypothetical protein